MQSSNTYTNTTRTRTVSEDWSNPRSFSRSDSIDSTSSTVYSYLQYKPSPRSLSGCSNGIACDEYTNNLILQSESCSSLDSVNTNTSTIIVSPMTSYQSVQLQAQPKTRPMSAKYRKRREREIGMGESRIPTPIEPLFPRPNSFANLSNAQEKDAFGSFDSTSICKLPDIHRTNSYHKDDM